MQQLSGQDASFFYFETPRTPMHVGSISIYDQSVLPGGVQGFKDIVRQVESRLHMARTFRQKLVQVPFSLDHPYWIEDKDFDIEFHTRHIRLPQPGDWRQLCIQVARLHSRPLDLAKPLWEFTIIEGLDNIEGVPKGCYAIVSKVHHARIDGVSGVDMIQAIHDIDPAKPNIAPIDKPWSGENEPNPVELLTRASINNALLPFRFAEVAARTIPALGRITRGMMEKRFESAKPVPRTRFNGTVTAHRVVEGRNFDLKEVRWLKSAVPGATINDVIVTICGGALRQYLETKGELPEQSMVAMAPISVRSKDERGTMGNQVAAMNVAIGTHIADAIERLTAVHADTLSSKEMTQAVGAKLMTDYSQFIPSTTAALAARLYTRLGMANRTNPVFNCVITNVPGPQFPLYCAGAPMVAQFGLGPLFDGMGLIFPVVSYNGRISISVTSCREMMPDPEFFARCLEDSYADLKAGAMRTLGAQA
ncbi:MAG: wax ester/triacylglycerol synthase family O-acyltransferase [Gammaproteobacteria bacterium]|nr:wax ester/triacylglycerol synthase family O-acyltransferase [Gammaproteobacteria bacterium]